MKLSNLFKASKKSVSDAEVRKIRTFLGMVLCPELPSELKFKCNVSQDTFLEWFNKHVDVSEIYTLKKEVCCKVSGNDKELRISWKSGQLIINDTVINPDKRVVYRLIFNKIDDMKVTLTNT